MTPQAFPKGRGLKCQVLPANVHSKVTRRFYTLWFFQMSWAASLLGAIMMLIGVAGTEDRVAADSVMPATQQGISVMLCPPHPSHASLENILLRASEQFRGLTPILKSTEIKSWYFQYIFEVVSLRYPARVESSPWSDIVPNKLSTAWVGGGRVWVSGIKSFNPSK